MGNYANYTLLLGVKLNLEPCVTETNPEWKGLGDIVHPSRIISSFSLDDYMAMPCQQRFKKDPRYAYQENEINLGYILPNESLVQNCIADKTFAGESECDTTRLCFIHDERWLGDSQLFGVAVLDHSTRDGYHKGDEKKILAALDEKERIAQQINRYGFRFTAADLGLHQYIMVEV